MAKCKVTIGLCVRDGETQVQEAIKSIIDQDFPHEFMEAIFVDDGSSDKTLSILNSYLPRMDMETTIFHHEWKGLGYSRNVVVDNAKSEYIVWVDCDMRLSKDFVRKHVEFMKNNPKVGIGKGKYGLYNVASLVGILENMYSVTNDLRDGKEITASFGTGGSIYRVKSIRQVGGFEPRIRRGGEDTDAEHRLSEAGWLLCKTQGVFYEMGRKTWKGIWREYFGRGYDGNYVARKNGVYAMSGLLKMFPPAAILDEVLRSFVAYKLTNRKDVFLLPFHWAFKRTAWCLGFAVGCLGGRS